MKWQITPGIIDKTAVRAFKYGACGGLAIALHDATGWPIVSVGSYEGEALHYMVRCPAGRLVDIEGAHTDDDVTLEYEPDADDGIVTLADTSRDAVWSWYRDEQGEPVRMDVVRSIASRVLEGI
ncbi:hypothetical protein ABZ547_08345 [Streptomyces sparsogenes]|uniref:hypothetical protein n=1 Tax=Streptomyces sparsogenes TaxID=67365 RepID=UPI0034101AEC